MRHMANKASKEPRLIRAGVAAAHFGVTPLTISQWRKKGVLPGVRVGREWRYRPEDIAKLHRSWNPDEEPAA